MRYEFKLPDIGEGMVEGEIVKWHVKPGDQLAEDAPMLDVMTDKATVTISAPKGGKVLELRAKEGEVKKVGEVLIALETAEAQSGKTEPTSSSPRQTHLPTDGGVEKRKAPTAGVATAPSGQSALATPATRRLAHELGVDLTRVSGSGPGGRITAEDVRAFLDGSTPKKVTVSSGESKPQKVEVLAGEERIPFRGMRRKIAEKMVASKTKIPHFTYVEEADVTELVALRDKMDSEAASNGARLTYLPFIVKAVVAALKKYPTLNSVLDEERHEIVLKHYYNIGVGAATPEGLTVFVVKKADEKNIVTLAKEVQQMGEKARAGKLSIEELQGSTFTITSLGALGGMFATPIINYPEVAILGIHRINKRPVVRDNQIVIRDMMYVSLSFDHRVIDGDVGAQFANEVIKSLQSPASLA